ncbi:hypothetical protein ACRAWD_18065 [Caulobacter segnis]
MLDAKAERTAACGAVRPGRTGAEAVSVLVSAPTRTPGRRPRVPPEDGRRDLDQRAGGGRLAAALFPGERG